MKKLTQEEFEDRAEAIARAKEIFTPHMTNNITIAFEIYQEMLAERERQLTLSTERERDYGILANLQRPLCPACSKELGLRLINIPKGKDNLYGYASSWVCEDLDCLYEEFSLKTLNDWLDTLPKKEKNLIVQNEPVKE